MACASVASAARLPLLRARPSSRSAPGLTVVHGPNGAGKSNLLEALYFGCTGRSPRTRNERELVRFGAQAARVVGAPARRRRRRTSWRRLRTLGEAQPVKRMTRDGAPVERLLDVAAAPARERLLARPPGADQGPPGAAARPPRPVRRRAVAGARRRARASTRGRSRSATRCSGAIRAGRGSRATLAAVGSRARRSGARRCARDRARGGRRCSPSRSPSVPRSSGSPASRARLPPALARADAEECVAELERAPRRRPRARLHRPRPAPRRARVSRDGRELRAYGSQGEQRLALLALLLAEREALAEQRDARR